MTLAPIFSDFMFYICFYQPRTTRIPGLLTSVYGKISLDRKNIWPLIRYFQMKCGICGIDGANIMSRVHCVKILKLTSPMMLLCQFNCLPQLYLFH